MCHGGSSSSHTTGTGTRLVKLQPPFFSFNEAVSVLGSTCKLTNSVFFQKPLQVQIFYPVLEQIV